MNRDAKIGLISIIFFLSIFYILSSFNVFTPIKPVRYNIYVYWDNANGLREGSSVVMKGVYSGEVGHIEFSNNKQKAKVTLKIDPYKKIPEKSNFMIVSGFVGDKWVSIEPGTGATAPSESEFYGISPISMGDDFRLMIAQIDWITMNADYVKEKAIGINKIVSDEKFKKKLKEKVLNVRDSTKYFNKTVAQADDNIDVFSESFQDGVVAMAAQMAVTADGIRHNMAVFCKMASLSVNKMDRNTQRAGEDVSKMVAKMKTSSENLIIAVETITDNLDPQTGIPPKLKRALFSIRQTCMSVEESAQEMLAFSEKGSDYREDLKVIMANTNKALDRIDTTLTSVLGYVKEEERSKSTGYRGNYEMLLTGSKDEFNADIGANFYLENDEDTFLHLGVTDISRPYSYVNLQLGKKFTKNLTFRGGMVKSSFGGGFDYKWGNTVFSLDLFDFSHHNSYIDVKGRYLMNKNFELILGVDDVLEERELKMGFGLKF